MYYLPAGRSVLRKTVPEVLSTARGRRPRAVLKTEGTVFLNTDLPRPANNIFIFFLLFFKSLTCLVVFGKQRFASARKMNHETKPFVTPEQQNTLFYSVKTQKSQEAI